MENKFYKIIIIFILIFILYNVIDLFYVEKIEINLRNDEKIVSDTKAIIVMPSKKDFINDYFTNLNLNLKQEEKKVVENVEMKDGYIVLYDKISGIIIKEKGNEVIIDGYFYKKGDLYKKMEITDILSDRIYLKKDNKKYVIFFK